MANRRFIDFPIATTVGDSDIILIWQSGVNKQTTKATFLSGLPENLEDLNDVAISGLTNGQILRYDSVTGKWENTDQGNLDLNDLNDVSIVSPSNGQVLVYNSSTSKWENSSGGFVPYVGAVTTVDLGAQGLRAGYVRFDTSVASVPDEQGLMYWDDSRSTAALIMNGTLQHIGQDTFFYVKNSSGSNIPKGTCVRFAGTDGASGHLLVAPFLANGSVPSSYFMGVTAEAIANGSFGQVMHFGELEGINTSGFTAGALLYASTTVAGGFQTTVPVAPNNIVLVAAAVNSKNNGAIIVRPQIGSNINNDEGVKITSPTTGDLLQLQAGGLWENKTLAQVIGSAYVPSTRTITINGVTQDLSANRTFNVGTVTSVGLSSATSGVTIGSTPVTSSGTITLAIATASGSQNGLLSSTDWTTFNNKQNALTNPVTGTGASGQVAYFNGTTTITSESNLFWDATNDRLGIGTSSPTDRLTLHRDGATGVYAHWRNNSNANNAYIGITGSGLMQIQNNGNIDFYTGASYNNQMTLAGTGNLIIGNPGSDNGARLQVSGAATLTNLLVGTSATQNGRATIATSSDEYLDIVNTTEVNTKATGIRFGNYSTTDGFKKAGIFYQSVGDGASRGDLIIALNTAFNANNVTPVNAVMTFKGTSGNLLVGTTTDNGARLQVSGGITALNSLVVTSSSNAALIASTNSTTGFSYLDFINSGASGRNYQIGVAGNGASSGYANNLYFDLVGVGNIMTLTSGRNVGIGTSSPAAIISGTETTLNVKGNVASAVGSIVARSFGTTNATAIGIAAFDTINQTAIFTESNSPMALYTNSTERMRITSSGNVGIGTSSPIPHNGTNALVVQGGSGSRGIMEIWDNSGAGGKAVFQQVGGDTYLGSLAKGTGSGDLYLLVNGTGTSASISTTLKANGNVGIGTSSPSQKLVVQESGDVFIQIRNNTVGQNFFIGALNGETRLNNDNNTPITMWVNGSERMRITSSGNVGIGTTSPNKRLQVEASVAGEVTNIKNTRNNSIGDYGLVTELGTNDNNTNNYHYIAATGGADRLYIYGNGNVVNTNGSYGTLSDISLKENIVDATPKLADLLQLKVRNFNLIGSEEKQIGFIAQELEEIFPKMVDVNGINKMKSIKTSVLVPMLVKAIQELKQEIDTLKN